MKDWADEEGDESGKYKSVYQPISVNLNQSRLSQSDFTLPSEILVSQV